MYTDGLYSLFLTALFALLFSISTEANTVKLNVREGLTNYLLHCFNHGSASNDQKRISWFYSASEITDAQIPSAFNAGNMTFLASWSGSVQYISDKTAWTLDDYQIGGKYSLRIFNASFPRDDGFFYCVDRDSRDIIRRFHLVILVKITDISIQEARLVDGAATVNATEGQTTQLSCRVNRANPSPEFLWTKNNHLFTNASYPDSGDVNLGLINFVPTRDMNGQVVRCLANNKNGPDEIASTNLNVFYSPVATVSWQSGVNVLKCEAEGNPLQFEFFYWEHRVRGTLVETLKGSTSGSTSVLHLPPAGYTPTGDYICSVSNGIGTRQSTSHFVQPKTAPVFEIRSRTILAPSGGRLDISVGFYSFPTFQDLVWEKTENDRTVKLDFHKEKPAYPNLDFKGTSAHLAGNVTTISFEAVKQSDSGLYTVIVTNSEGASSYSITLKVHDPPVVPSENQNTIPVKEDIDVESQPIVNVEERQSAARQGSEEPTSTFPSTMVAVVSCVSVVVIILVVVGVCLLKHGKISLYVRRSKYSDSNGSGSQCTGSTGSEGSLPFEETRDNSSTGKGSVDRSFMSYNTESTAGSLCTISETQKITVTYPPKPIHPSTAPPSITGLNTKGLLPAGTLQSIV